MVKSALVVEDDERLAMTLGAFARTRAEAVHVVTRQDGAAALLGVMTFDAALIDLALPDGSGLDLLPLLFRQPAMPRVIVISGSATPAMTFALAQAGVRQFVAKPVTLAELERAWEEAIEAVPDLRPLLRASVGVVPLSEMEKKIRRDMAEEALARARDNRRRAAGLLGISRQLLQYILRNNNP